MKIRKGKIELSINPDDWQQYKKAGWLKKRERKPEVRRKYYLESLTKKGSVE